MPTPAMPADGLDSAAAWRRLVVSVLLTTIGGVGMWSVVVVLPAVQAEFGAARGAAAAGGAAQAARAPPGLDRSRDRLAGGAGLRRCRPRDALRWRRCG